MLYAPVDDGSRRLGREDAFRLARSTHHHCPVIQKESVRHRRFLTRLQMTLRVLEQHPCCLQVLEWATEGVPLRRALALAPAVAVAVASLRLDQSLPFGKRMRSLDCFRAVVIAYLSSAIAKVGSLMKMPLGSAVAQFWRSSYLQNFSQHDLSMLRESTLNSANQVKKYQMDTVDRV